MWKLFKISLSCIFVAGIVPLWGISDASGDGRTVILSENFDAVSAPNLPTGWTVINNDNDNQTWETHTVSPISPPNSLWSAFSNYEPKDDYLVTPPMQLTSGQTYYVSFKYRSGYMDWEKFRVLLGSAPTVSSLTTMVYNNPGFNNDVPQTATATFTIGTTGTYYLAWHHYSDAEQYILSVDDIEVGEGSPNPPNRPYLFYPNDGLNYASIDGFDLEWTQTYPSGPVTHWEVYMSQNQDNVLADHSWISYYPHFNPVSEGGLTFAYDQTWYWTVKAFNGDGAALALEPHWFQIHSDPTVSSFPWMENFDGVQFPDMVPGWTVYNLNNDYYPWLTSPDGQNADSNALTIIGNSELPKNDWAISPPLVLEAGQVYQLQFSYWSVYGQIYGPEFMRITLGESNWYGSHDTFLWDLYTFSNSEPMTYTDQFSVPVSGTYYLGWYACTLAGMGSIKVDNVSVEMLVQGIPGMPILEAPLSGATGLDAEGFELSWSPDLAGGAPASYKVYISQNEDTLLDGPFWVTTNTHFNPVTEGDLDLGYLQTWYWTVEAINAEGSAIADPPFWFETMASTMVINFPWTENFEGAIFPPANWTNWKIYDDSPCEWIRTGEYNHSPGGSYAAKHARNAIHYSEGWLVSPAIALPASAPMMLSFWNLNTYAPSYEYQGVYVSTVSPDPGDNTFEELWNPSYVENQWLPVSASLELYAGQTIYIGFMYTGANANEWYIDDLRISDLNDFYASPEITHRRHLNTYVSDAPYPISAVISDPDGVREANLHYQINYGDFVTVPMSNQGGDNYLASIPAQPLNTHISYYFTATDDPYMTNYTESEGYGFEVEEPALLSYAEGDVTAVVGSNSQSWEARIVYYNPGGRGNLMKINSISASFLHPETALLQVLVYENGIYTPIMQPLEVYFSDALNTIDVSHLNIQVISERFMISLSQIARHNYINVIGPNPYADMNYFVMNSVEQSFPSMGIDRVYQIDVEVQTGLAELSAPQLSINYTPAGIELSWPPVPGATAYKVHVSDDPFGVGTWTLIATTEATSYIYPATQARRFFSVTAISGVN